MMGQPIEPVCPRCGAYLQQMECPMCPGVEYNLDQAHKLLDRAFMYAMYGGNDEEQRQLWRDIEVWLRVAGPPKS